MYSRGHWLSLWFPSFTNTIPSIALHRKQPKIQSVIVLHSPPCWEHMWLLLDCALKGRGVHPIPCVWCSVAQLYLAVCNPMDCSPLGSCVHGIPRQEYLWEGCHFLLQGSSRYLASPALAGGFFNTEPPGFVDPYPCQHTNTQWWDQNRRTSINIPLQKGENERPIVVTSHSFAGVTAEYTGVTLLKYQRAAFRITA